jgi:hypothetical protein
MVDPGVVISVVIVAVVVVVFAYRNRAYCFPPAAPPNLDQYQQEYY